MHLGQERWLRMASVLAGHSVSGQTVDAGLCAGCVAALSVAGAGITIMAGDNAQVRMCASDATVRRLADLEFSLGYGPAVDAYQRGEPVLETDLVGRPPAGWPAFAGPAVDAGIRAIFAFPLRVGAARLGALTLFQMHPGDLGDDILADALIAADVITSAVMARQAGISEEALMDELTQDIGYHAEVHQASGMVAVQLQISVGDALARLRGRAFALDQPIDEVAVDVVARRLRFSE